MVTGRPKTQVGECVVEGCASPRYSKSLCRHHYQKRIQAEYRAKKPKAPKRTRMPKETPKSQPAPPAKPVPENAVAEVEDALDALMDDYHRAIEPPPYAEPETRDCLPWSDMVEIEDAARRGWDGMEKKAKEELANAKGHRGRAACVGRHDLAGRLGKRDQEDA